MIGHDTHADGDRNSAVAIGDIPIELDEILFDQQVHEWERAFGGHMEQGEHHEIPRRDT